jgi:FG-GAP-like repeat/FG-GAP repeat
MCFLVLRITALAVSFVLPCGTANSQACSGVGFTLKAQIPLAAPFGQLLVADLNGDGRPDLVNVDSTGVRVSLNLGSGRFGPQVLAAGGASAAVAGDFDGDGKTDLAVARDSSLFLLIGDGAGGFREAGAIGPAGTLSSLVTGDFNGDGKPDLAALLGAWPFGTPVVLLNQGQGHFATQPPLTVNVANSVVAADFNGDGRTDLVVDQCGGGAVFLSNGDGTFAPGRPIAGLTSFCAWIQSELDAGDLNGDGFPNLVQTWSYKGLGFGVIVLLGDGHGGFSALPQAGFFDILPGGPRRVAIRDFDGDGFADVAVGTSSSVAVMRGDGKGDLGPPAYFPALAPRDVLAADFDGDGRPDLLTSFGNLLTNTCRAGGFERVLAVPVLVSTPGEAGANYESDIAITNAGSSTTTLELTYTATTGGGSGTAVTTLPPGTQVSDPSAFHFLAGLGLDTGGPGPHIGTLRAQFEGLSSPHGAGISVRVSSGGGGVAFGGVEPDPEATQIVGWLKEDASDRSNLALVNAGGTGDGDILLRVTLTSTDPAVPGQIVLPDVALSVGAFRQFNHVLATSGLGAASAYASIARVAGSAPFLAWGVINDQVTSDGSVVLPKDGNRLTTVVETPAYDTEVVITNLDSTDATVSLRYSAATHTDAWADLTVTVPAGSMWRTPSFVDFLRQRGNTGMGSRGDTVSGTLDVSSDQYVRIGARISTAAPGGGRYGVFLSPVPYDSVFGPQTSAWIPDLRQDTSFRTNLVLVGGVFRVEIFDSTGHLVATQDGVVEGQINGVLKVWAPGLTRGWARVTRTATLSGEDGLPFSAYAVINDGAEPGLGTGDGSIVWMEPNP